MKERLIISLILLLIAYAVCGCEDKPEDKPPDYQTSEYEWDGDHLSLLQELLPEGMDLGGWKISCPKCAGSPNLLRLYEETIERKIGAVVEVPCKWYCSKCYYPLGVDWNISIITRDFVEIMEHAETVSIDAPGVTIIGCKFELDPNEFIYMMQETKD